MIRGGGDLATGVALRLIRSGIPVVITELAQPLAVRRSVSFAEAVYAGEMSIEGITACCVGVPTDTLRINTTLGNGQVPVLVDPDCTSARFLHPKVIIDGRMIKQSPEPIGYIPDLYIGLGPGFEAGVNCQAVVETRRGHMLGRVYFCGTPQSDTGQPDGDPQRVLRAPCDGLFVAHKQIGDHCKQGDLLAEVQSSTDTRISAISSPFPGILRGLLHSGLIVVQHMKVGDLDPRDDPRYCQFVSEKALAIGGGVLEAILSRPDVREGLWN
jgi:xanthine dehydrogenase accessory factor